MTHNEFQTWLASLTPEQRHIADTVISVYGDMLLLIEGRQQQLESRHRELEKRLYDTAARVLDCENRIAALEAMFDDDELDVLVDFEDVKITSAA